MNIKEQIFNLLSERLSGDTDFNDYENKEAVLDYAIETIQEDDSLTQGCGVGPLMNHIEEWVENFEKEAQDKNLSLPSKLNKM